MVPVFVLAVVVVVINVVVGIGIGVLGVAGVADEWFSLPHCKYGYSCPELFFKPTDFQQVFAKW